MKKIIYFLFPALVFVLSTYFSVSTAQGLTETKDSIYSDILQEQRTLRVFVPDTWKPGSEEKYEVIYLTDGEWVSEVFPFIYKFNRNENYIPQLILVAIPNTYIDKVNQRDRDFLPVHVNDNAISGGADKFLSFLKNELIPYINKTYPSNGTNSLYGHSYGGLFSMYAFLAEPELFECCFATDPSFWWNKDFAVKLAAEKLGDIKTERHLWIAGIESTYKGMGIGRMDSVLKLKAPENIYWKIGLFPNESHNSVRLKAIYDGLKFSYAGYPGTPAQFHPMNGILLKDKPTMIFIAGSYPDLRYTVDGTEPTSTSPQAEQMFTITGPAQLSIKSFIPGAKYGATAKGNFELGEVMPSLPKIKNAAPGGLKYSYYEGSWDSLPDFSKLKPVATGVFDTTFNFQKLSRNVNFACLFEGYLEVVKDGYYIFGINSDDGAKLYLGDKLILNNDGLHDDSGTKSFVLPLQKGFYPVRLEYFQKEGGSAIKLVYLVPETTPVNPIMIPFKLLYHK
jgi:predicted alpha/beta superfamily hydrolase